MIRSSGQMPHPPRCPSKGPHAPSSRARRSPMRDGYPSLFGRLRAGLATALAWLAAGSRRMEEWTARHTRAVLVSLVVGVLLIGALLVGMFGIAREGRAVTRWVSDGPRAERYQPGPVGKPAGRHQEGWHREGRHHRGPAGKPEGRRPAPPPPPTAPQPPPAP